MITKLSVAMVAAAGFLFSPLILAEQATPAPTPAEPRPSARTLLKIGTGYSIWREKSGMSLWAPRWGFIDEQGKTVIEPRYKEVWDSSEGITPVNQNGKWGWFDQSGAYVDAQLDRPVRFQEGLASFERDGKKGFIDPGGKAVIEPQWEEASNFSEGLASVTQRGQYGFIDKTGKLVIKPRWELAGDFHEGRAGVKEKGKWGCIDKTGKVVIKVEWDEATAFWDGYAAVVRNNKWGVINKEGKVVVPLEWEELIMPCSLLLEPHLQYDMPPDAFEAQGSGAGNQKRGCYDQAGKMIADPDFEKLGGFSHRLDPKDQDGKWGLIDGTKRFVVEPQWEIVSPYQPAKGQVYWLVAREDKTSDGKSVVVEWLDPKGKKIWSSTESAAR